MKHAFSGHNRVPVPPVFRQPFVFNPSAVPKHSELTRRRWRTSKLRQRALMQRRGEQSA